MRWLCVAVALCMFPVLVFGQSHRKLILKVNSENTQLFSNGEPHKLQSVWEHYNLQVPQLKFPLQVENEIAIRYGIERIYELKIPTEDRNLNKLLYQLERSNLFEYVEWAQKGELAFTPNDPQFGQQAYLSAIGAPEAWDSTQGNTSIVVALLDAGIDTSHEDLKGKFVVNNADPKNGIDDDNDGYVDN